jgi:hypothetical protein
MARSDETFITFAFLYLIKYDYFYVFLMIISMFAHLVRTIKPAMKEPL